MRRTPSTTLFPYTTLFRSVEYRIPRIARGEPGHLVVGGPLERGALRRFARRFAHQRRSQHPACLDRKSTRLNSSHGYISYAVFCLTKKKTLPCLLDCHT